MTHGSVRREIEELHECFEGWFNGTLESLDRVERTLDEDFLFVSPGAAIVPRAQLMSGLAAGRAGQSMRIRVEQVQVRWTRGDLVAATYEEWHVHDSYTTKRQSSIVMQVDASAPGGYRWLSVHETWLQPPPNRDVTSQA